jgi:hypothetical protein
MTIRHSDRVRNAMAQAVTSTIAAASASASAVLQLWSGTVGSEPASASAAATGSLLGSATIPGSYMGTPAAGVQSLASQVSGQFTANGTVRYYRVISGDGACDEQGTVTLSGGGGDLTLTGVASLAVTAGQPFTITARAITGSNA